MIVVRLDLTLRFFSQGWYRILYDTLSQDSGLYKLYESCTFMCTVRAFASLCALVVSTHYRKDGPAMSPMLSFCAILEILVKEVFRCVHFGVFAFLRFLRSSNPHASASRLKAKADAPKAEASIPCKANSFDKEGKYKIWNKIHRAGKKIAGMRESVWARPCMHGHWKRNMIILQHMRPNVNDYVQPANRRDFWRLQFSKVICHVKHEACFKLTVFEQPATARQLRRKDRQDRPRESPKTSQKTQSPKAHTEWFPRFGCSKWAKHSLKIVSNKSDRSWVCSILRQSAIQRGIFTSFWWLSISAVMLCASLSNRHSFCVIVVSVVLIRISWSKTALSNKKQTLWRLKESSGSSGRRRQWSTPWDRIYSEFKIYIYIHDIKY